MKRFTKEVTNPDIVWVAYVDPLAMKEMLANLIDKEVYGFHVSDDRGGSGSWKIRFDADYDEEQVLGFMVRIDHNNWTLMEVGTSMVI